MNDDLLARVIALAVYFELSQQTTSAQESNKYFQLFLEESQNICNQLRKDGHDLEVLKSTISAAGR